VVLERELDLASPQDVEAVEILDVDAECGEPPRNVPAAERHARTDVVRPRGSDLQPIALQARVHGFARRVHDEAVASAAVGAGSEQPVAVATDRRGLLAERMPARPVKVDGKTETGRRDEIDAIRLTGAQVDPPRVVLVA